MVSLIRFLTEKKIDCAVMVTVNRIEGDFKDAYNFSVTFEHKKIVQESPIFRMDSRTSVVDVNCIFH